MAAPNAPGPAVPSPPAAAAVCRPCLRLWGTPVLDGQPPLRFAAERRFQLLLVLALAGGAWVERDRLAALLWPEAAMADARRNLRKVLLMARGLPGVPPLEADASALRWAVDSDAHVLRHSGPDDGERLLALRQGEPLQGLDDARNAAWSAWLATERAQLDRLWTQRLHALLAQTADASTRARLARALCQADALDEAAVAALIDAELALGRPAAAQEAYRVHAEALAHELGVEPAQSLRSRLAPPAARADAAGDADHGFVGRRRELAALQGLFESDGVRLVTLLGAGGIGKSRLAREWLARQPAGGGPALWIELQDLDDLQAVVSRWARAMGLEVGDDPDPPTRLARLAAAAPPGGALVVLDNAEHLPGLAPLLDAALGAWPGLRLLVTSRLRLQSESEWVLALGGLALPDADGADPAAAAAVDAVRLFERAARRVQPGFQLATEWPQVLALVRALEGVPLALELAAGWVRLMPLAAVVQELVASPMALERPAQAGAPARPDHDRLRDLASRTLALLAPAERLAAEGASVFGGGFTRGAAQAVMQSGLSVLSSLCDKSLLRFDGERFRIHPWMQALLAERLAADAARRQGLVQRHAAHFAQRAAELLPHVSGVPRALLGPLQADEANFRIAWQHAVAAGLHAELRDLALPLATYFDLQGRLAEGTALLRPALRQQPADPTACAAQAAVRRGLAGLLLRQGQLADADAVAAGGVALGGGGPDGIACRLAQGAVRWEQGDPAAAHAFFEQALAEAQALGDRPSIGLALGQLGLSHGDLGQAEAAMRCLHEALAIHRELGHVAQTVVQLAGVAGQHVIQRELPLARPWLDEAWQLARQHGLVREQVQIADILSFVRVQSGATAAAREMAEAGLQLATQTGMSGSRLGLVQTLARIEMADGRFDAGQRRVAEAIEQGQQLRMDSAVMRAVRTGAELLAAAGRGREAARLFQGLQRCALATPWDLESFERLLARLPADAVATAAGEPAVGGTLDELIEGWRQARAGG